MKKKMFLLFATVVYLLRCASPASAQTPTPVWGFADLHTHPASFLGFGADQNGDNGIFWGKPGLNLAFADPNADMPPCLRVIPVLFPNDITLLPEVPIPVPTFHGAPVDYVRYLEQKSIMDQVDAIGNTPHNFGHGATGFETWPAARSVEHQQMHVTAIKRAFDGGLRLLFAAATDNQVLSTLWSKIGFNYAPQVPAPDPNFDFNSAARQLQFIQAFVAANGSWMRIVTTPQEARQAIKDKKLAVVLSLEMDSLSLDQILTLVRQFNVRHVIPIHLANNSFGGSAVYSDLWNANTYFLNHSFYQVDFDSTITFRLNKPQALHGFPPGLVVPMDISDGEFQTLNYDPRQGHKNRLGLSDKQGLLPLMRQGLLLDVAHMSEKAAGDVIEQAELHNYPVMDSHTGIREPFSKNRSSERNLLRSHAMRIGNLGGVIGMGMAWVDDETAPEQVAPVTNFLRSYQDALPLLGGRGIAFGTDANGFQPLMDHAEMVNGQKLISYPFTIDKKYGPPGGPPIGQLPNFQLGSRTYDINDNETKRGGMANYGMLPDFIQALDGLKALQPTQAIAALYGSAEDVIQMWEKSVSAAAMMGGGGVPANVCTQPAFGSCLKTASDDFSTCTKREGPPPPGSGEPNICQATLRRAVTSCRSTFCTTAVSPPSGTILVKENLLPSVDPGRFRVSIDQNVELANAGGLATFGSENLSVGTHFVREDGIRGTDLTNYVVEFTGDCASNDTSGGPFTRPVAVSAGQQKACTITNKGRPVLGISFRTTPNDDPGLFSLTFDRAPLLGSDGKPVSKIYGQNVITGLASAPHTISWMGDGSTKLSEYSPTVRGDCTLGSDMTSATITMQAGDEKTCSIRLVNNVGGCPSGQHCCGKSTSTSGCIAGCIPNATQCQPLCPPGNDKCCGGPRATGECDSVCVSSKKKEQCQ